MVVAACVCVCRGGGGVGVGVCTRVCVWRGERGKLGCTCVRGLLYFNFL